MRAHASGGLSADIARLPELEPEIVVAELDASVVTAHLDPIDSADELALAPLLAMARSRLDPLGCDVVVRAFHPVSVPALHLDDRAARHERARAEAEAQANDLWAGILSSLRDTSARARLVLNYLNPWYAASRLSTATSSPARRSNHCTASPCSWPGEP
jgi:molecular chaperone HtpG